MPTKKYPDPWSNAIAHIDADCFFASCELVRRPELIGSPLCILSSQDACIIAKTYDAKAAGIKTAMPVWEAKKLLPHASYLSADFGFYGLLSEKMFSILRRYSPDLEIYSIDEGFLDLNGTRALWNKSYEGIAHDIRRAVHREVGITVSVGVSVTRILAKMASEYNKPNGVSIVSDPMIMQFLKRTSLSDITGIGRKREALLRKSGIHSPVDFVNSEMQVIQSLLGKAGTDLWFELHGKSVMALELQPPLPKSMARTASMGAVTSNRKTISSHLTRHTTRLATALVNKRLLAKRFTIFLKPKGSSSLSRKTDFEYPTNNYFRLSRAVQQMMADLYDPHKQYRACGVIAEQISKAEQSMPDLFGHMKADMKEADLLITVESINKKYGRDSLKMAAAFSPPSSKSNRRFIYPVIIAH